MQIINDMKALARMVTELKKSGATFNDKLHIVAFNYLAHVANTGDVRPLQHLYDALPGEYTSKALAVWATSFGSVTFNTKDKKFKVKKDKPFDRDSAEAIRPTDYVKKSANTPKPFDIASAIDALLAKAKKNNVKAAVLRELTEARAAV